MKKFASLLALALVSNFAVAADNTNYLGLDYTWGVLDDKAGNDFELDGVRVRFGQYFVPHLALEIHFLYGTSGDTITSGAARVEVDNKHTTSVFLRGDIGDKFKLYGLVGYSETTFESTITGAGYTFPGRSQERDVSYGGGFEYLYNKHTSLDISYVVYHDEEYLEYAGASLGFTRRF